VKLRLLLPKDYNGVRLDRDKFIIDTECIQIIPRLWGGDQVLERVTSVGWTNKCWSINTEMNSKALFQHYSRGTPMRCEQMNDLMCELMQGLIRVGIG
jgi:hypothetical protein